MKIRNAKSDWIAPIYNRPGWAYQTVKIFDKLHCRKQEEQVIHQVVAAVVESRYRFDRY